MVLAFNILVGVLTGFFVLVCLFMMLVILVQKPKGGGLSGAFGGAGSAQSVMGAKTGEFLTWFTVGCFVAFLLLAMGLTWAINAEPHTAEAIAARAAEEAAPASQATPDSSSPQAPSDPLTELPDHEPEASDQPVAPNPPTQPDAPATATTPDAPVQAP